MKILLYILFNSNLTFFNPNQKFIAKDYLILVFLLKLWHVFKYIIIKNIYNKIIKMNLKNTFKTYLIVKTI